MLSKQGTAQQDRLCGQRSPTSQMPAAAGRRRPAPLAALISAPSGLARSPHPPVPSPSTLPQLAAPEREQGQSPGAPGAQALRRQACFQVTSTTVRSSSESQHGCFRTLQRALAMLAAPAEGSAPLTSFQDLPDEVSAKGASTGTARRPALSRRCRRRPVAARRPATFHLTPQNLQVLALVASVGLTDARDLASFAATSKRCAAICRAAPLRLGVVLPAGAAPQEEQAAARATLQQLCASFPGEVVYRRMAALMPVLFQPVVHEPTVLLCASVPSASAPLPSIPTRFAPQARRSWTCVAARWRMATWRRRCARCRRCLSCS